VDAPAAQALASPAAVRPRAETLTQRIQSPQTPSATWEKLHLTLTDDLKKEALSVKISQKPSATAPEIKNLSHNPSFQDHVKNSDDVDVTFNY
jgi:hypothetical protein